MSKTVTPEEELDIVPGEREENAASHRITQEADAVIRQFIDERTQDEAIATDFHEYYLAHKSTHYAGQIQRVTYESLDEILRILHVSYREFLEACNKYPDNAKVDWSTPTRAGMAKLLDLMDDKQKEPYYAMFRAMLPKAVQSALNEAESMEIYGLRIVTLLEAFCNDDSYCINLFSEIGIRERWRQKKRGALAYTTCPHEYLPIISSRTGVSLHWMLGCNCPVLAQSESTERVMDLFCLLTEEQQEEIFNGLDRQIKAGGVLLNGV